MNINFNNRNNNKYLILLFIVSIFSAIVFLASYKDIQWVFANSQVSMKDEMNNMTKMQNQNMMMDSSQMQKMMMEQMNKTGMGMMMGPMMGMGPMMMDSSQMQKMMMEQMNKTGMMMGPMMGMAQNMTMPCMMMAPMMIGNQTKMGVTPCLIMMDPSQMQKMMMEHMKDPKHLHMMMEQMNKTGMMMKNTNK